MSGYECACVCAGAGVWLVSGQLTAFHSLYNQRHFYALCYRSHSQPSLKAPRNRMQAKPEMLGHRQPSQFQHYVSLPDQAVYSFGHTLRLIYICSNGMKHRKTLFSSFLSSSLLGERGKSLLPKKPPDQRQVQYYHHQPFPRGSHYD